jgi:hypothetical protein
MIFSTLISFLWAVDMLLIATPVIGMSASGSFVLASFFCLFDCVLNAIQVIAIKEPSLKPSLQSESGGVALSKSSFIIAETGH